MCDRVGASDRECQRAAAVPEGKKKLGPAGENPGMPEILHLPREIELD
ncbi:hypothetical protein QT971_10655 [Microcoleus sp. herbarium19]